MIFLATKEDKNLIENIYQETFNDGSYHDYYFNNIYDLGKHYVLKENDEIISIASSFKSTYMLNQRFIRVSMIDGLVTLKKYRNQGYMTKLLNEILDQLSHQELVTMIKADNPLYYIKYGFEILYRRKTYYFNRDNFKITQTKGMSENINLDDTIKAYALFTKHFNGFKYRDKNDFKLILKELESLNKKMMMVYDDKQIKGYFIYRILDDKVSIDECIYLDTKTLTKIISYCLKLKENLQIEMSEGEDLEKIYGSLKYTTRDYMMARINDYELFNHLYNSEVDNVKDGFKLLNKPLYMHEGV